MLIMGSPLTIAITRLIPLTGQVRTMEVIMTTTREIKAGQQTLITLEDARTKVIIIQGRETINTVSILVAVHSHLRTAKTLPSKVQEDVVPNSLALLILDSTVDQVLTTMIDKLILSASRLLG